MTAEPVPLDALLAARQRMIHELQHGIDADEQRFLLSLLGGEPEWPLLGVARIERLPGIRWKLHNLLTLKKRNPKRFSEQAEALRAGLASLRKY